MFRFRLASYVQFDPHVQNLDDVCNAEQVDLGRDHRPASCHERTLHLLELLFVLVAQVTLIDYLSKSDQLLNGQLLEPINDLLADHRQTVLRIIFSLLHAQHEL